MFENLTRRLQDIFKNLRRRGKLTEKDVEEVLREVKYALLEADVNFRVVKDFIERVKEKAIGEELWKSLTPAQLVIKIVRDELIALMGGSQSKINISSSPPTIVELVGLHGSGKTTSVAKLGNYLKKQGHRPLLVAADVYRPAAREQLLKLGQEWDLSVFTLGENIAPLEIIRGAIKKAKVEGFDIVIIDTAGRLQIQEELMQELEEIKEKINPSEVLLVVDAMMGQEALNVTSTFVKRIGLDGVILTKLDGDARGGAALSIKAATGVPIKFVGVGEKADLLEPFYPDRMASRILGMGDVLSLIEKAEVAIDEAKAKELEQKIRTQSFNLEDFLEQLKAIKSMGPIEHLASMIPGLNPSSAGGDFKIDEKQFTRIEAIICSMTPQERQNPSIIGGSRKRRIARGSGTTVVEINKLLRQFQDMQRMMKHITKLEKKGYKLQKLLKRR